MTQKALKSVCLGILVLMLGIPALAQNTKGDRPEPTPRETRFKTPKKLKQTRPASRRVRRGDDRAGQPAGMPSRKRQNGERPGRPVGPQFSKTKPSKTERAWKGDVSGRRIRPTPSSGRAKNVYPQPSSINYSSRNLKRTLRQNENPNVRRVKQMQREESPKPKVGKPIRPVFHKSRPQRSERAWRGDITGRRIRAGSSDKLRPSPGAAPSRVMGMSKRTSVQRRGVVPPRVSGRAKNVFFRKSFYVNNQSHKPPRFQHERSRVPLGMLTRYNSRRKTGYKGGHVAPRSASAAYLARRSTNTWAHFRRPKRKQETATTRDIAGHKLRGKNYETKRPVLTNPTLNYQRRVATGERPYKGPAAGGYVSRTRPGRAWKGDIAHRAIRGGFRSKKGEPSPGAPLFGRAPGMGAQKIGRYQGNIKAGRRGFGNQGEGYSGNLRMRKQPKGGGTISGGWNNKGLPIQGRTPGRGIEGIGSPGNIRAGKRIFNDQGEEYTGNIRARRRETGGGSRSGRHWNNNNTPVIVRTPKGKQAGVAGYQGDLRVGRRGFEDQGEEYTGNIKTRRPEKGGKSISGKVWNNNNRPIAGRAYADHIRISRYSGNIKAKRPEQGGGSVSGKVWNNKQRPIDGRIYAGQAKISRYSGNIKAKRPEKGGGSVSGKVWNNGERPIDGRIYAGQTRISRYSGDIKAKRPEKGGGSISGKLWNNKETPIEVRTYIGQSRMNRYSGNMKATRPEKGGGEEGGYAGNIKIARNNYKRNPRSAEGAMPGLKANAASLKADRHTQGVRRNWDYIKNPSSADEAQRKREPGRAFVRAADFQGNIRVKKFDLFKQSDLHPDARFVRLNKNNVDEEKDMLTNFKLWWARLFRKAETQPDHLKDNDKSRNPRYDKGEAGLWYE